MKIVQSCWACNQPNLREFQGGWYGAEYNLMSWTLSCLQLRRYYKDVILYTDSVSARTLVDELRLPYSEVYCELDSLAGYDPKLWALAKILTYKKQEEPFVHVDGDVMIWEPFGEDLLASDLIAQNLETDDRYYNDIWTHLDKSLAFFPEEIRQERLSNEEIAAYNTGIVGGGDVGFFREYADKAMEFIAKNTQCIDSHNVADFNLCFEQYYFFCIAKAKKKQVGVLLPDLKGGLDYWLLGDFVEVPHAKKYLHLLGRLKRNREICDQLANRLRTDYPEYYYRIIALFKNNGLTLKRDYSTVFDDFNEHELVKRHQALRDGFISDTLPRTVAPELSRKFERSPLLVKLVTEGIDKAAAADGKPAAGYADQLADIQQFEQALYALLSDSFSSYSPDYLYGRDILYPASFEAVFGDSASGYDTPITTNPMTAILESQYDWSQIDLGEYGQMALTEQLMSAPSKRYTAVVPECHESGYSLVLVDELDLQLLELFKQPNTITSALSALESSFDESDLQESKAEFEELVAGRVKLALKHKLLSINCKYENRPNLLGV